MKNERKQLQLMINQLTKAQDIVIKQKKRYEQLMSEQYGYDWHLEYYKDNEISNGILGAIRSIECAIDNIYN